MKEEEGRRPRLAPSSQNPRSAIVDYSVKKVSGTHLLRLQTPCLVSLQVRVLMSSTPHCEKRSASDNEQVWCRYGLTRCIVRRQIDVEAVNFVRWRLVLRFPPTQLLYLDVRPVGRPNSHVIRIIVMQRLIFHSVGMFSAVIGDVKLIAGSFSVVDIVEVRLLSTS